MAKKFDLGLIGFTNKGKWQRGYSFTQDGQTFTGYNANDIASTDSGVYVSLTDGNADNPDEGGEKWQTWVDTSDIVEAKAAADAATAAPHSPRWT